MYCAQAETLEESYGAHEAFQAIRQVDPDYPLAVVTNLIGARMIPGWAAFINAMNVAWLVEVEAQLNPDWHNDPAGFAHALISEAKTHGALVVVPVFYVGGETYPHTLADYQPDTFPGYYVWLAETCPEVAGP